MVGANYAGAGLSLDLGYDGAHLMLVRGDYTVEPHMRLLQILGLLLLPLFLDDL